jgi:hypothetical protein
MAVGMGECGDKQEQMREDVTKMTRQIAIALVILFAYANIASATIV